MGKFIHENIGYIRKLCREAWERAKRFGGAFLNNVFIDMDGSIWYDTEQWRVRLGGWKVARKRVDIYGRPIARSRWVLERCL